MKVRRDISSIPLRPAHETWQTITKLITGTGSLDTWQLDAAATVMASLISDEAFKDEPLALAGVSHRLVIYLLHGSAALEHGQTLDALNWNPTAGDWTLFVPCPDEQFDWVKKTLASRAPRCVVLRPGEKPADEDAMADKAETISINWSAFNT
jgi:hypothetical protein